MRKQVTPCLLLLFLPFCALSQYQTLVLRPGPESAYCASIRTDAPSTNFSTDSNFIANAWTYHGNFFVQRSLIWFDFDQISEDAEIISARLSLYCNRTTGHHQIHSGENKALLSRVTTYWFNKNVNWNNQPSVTSQNRVVLPKSTNQFQDYENIDVTNLVKDMLPASENNYGFMIHLEVEQTYRCMVFASSWHNNEQWRPMLEIVYRECIPPQVSFTYTIEDSTVFFTSNSSNATAWFWSFDDGQYSIDEHPVHSYNNMIDRWVCLWSSNECGISQYCDSVFFCKVPFGSFSYNINGLFVRFNDTCHHTSQVYWNFGDGYYSDQNNPAYHYQEPGTYVVTLSMINECMVRSVVDTITIFDAGSGDNEFGFVISPNPCHGHFLINYLIPSDVRHVKVYDSRGRIIKMIVVNETVKNLDIDLGGCHSGVYYITSHYSDGRSEVGRVIVIYE